MNAEQTEKFAKVCKELSIYFFNLAPEPRKFNVSEGYEESYISIIDNLKKPENYDEFPSPPYDLQFLRIRYTEFNKEVDSNLKMSDAGFINKLVRHLLEDCLPYEKLLPLEEQFFKEKLFGEAEVLYNFKIISREINQKFGSMSLMGDPLPF